MVTTTKTQFDGVRIRHYKKRDVLMITFVYQNKMRREQIRLAPTIPNQRLAFNRLLRIQDEIARGAFDYAKEFPNSKEAAQQANIKASMSMKVALLDYLKDWQRSVDLGKKAESSYAALSKAVNGILIPAFGHYDLNEITPAILRDWIKGRNITGKTLNNNLTPLREIFTNAFIDHDIPNPFHKLDLPKLKKGFCKDSVYKVEPFTPDEVQAILKVAPPQAKNYIQFAFATGLRGGEMIGLRWGDIDWEKNEIHLIHNRVNGKDKPPKTSAGKRDVPLSKDALSALNAQKQWTYVMQDFVFHRDKTNAPYLDDQEVLKGMWMPVIKASGVRYRIPKQTRHTYASARLSRGENVHKVAVHMGHADATMVLQTYGKWIKQYEDEFLKQANA